MRVFHWTELTTEQKHQALLRPANQSPIERLQQTRSIVEEVRYNGDAALRRFAQKFDGVTLTDLRISDAELEKSGSYLSSGERKAIETAKANIERFHLMERPADFELEVTPGVRCGRLTRPLECVGLYIPGGTAPLPSTVLMLGVPATLAGCPTIALASPPNRQGQIEPAILYAATLCGIRNVFRIGGAQAIAALAFGTATVPKTDKVFGPGNAWVTQAKLLVAQDPMGAAIDMPAGPSEVMVICDDTANPHFVASDLLSQAEHGPDSHVVVVVTAQEMVPAIEAALEAQLQKLPRGDILAASLSHATAIVTESREQAIEVSNQYAPEHLILQLKEPRSLLDRIQHAGSVFLGPWSPESMGDYASGTNHVLPTYGYARSFSGIGVESFTKRITFQELTDRGIQLLGPTVETLATLEGLEAHRQAVSIRLASLPGAFYD